MVRPRSRYISNFCTNHKKVSQNRGGTSHPSVLITKKWFSFVLEQLISVLIKLVRISLVQKSTKLLWFDILSVHPFFLLTKILFWFNISVGTTLFHLFYIFQCLLKWFVLYFIDWFVFFCATCYRSPRRRQIYDWFHSSINLFHVITKYCFSLKLLQL